MDTQRQDHCFFILWGLGHHREEFSFFILAYNFCEKKEFKRINL